MIADQLRQFFSLSDPVGELPVDRLVQSRDPISGLAGQAQMAREQFFAPPVDDDMQITPHENLNHDLRHVNPPVAVRFDRARFRGACLAGRLQCLVFEDQQLVTFHQTENPFPVPERISVLFPHIVHDCK